MTRDEIIALFGLSEAEFIAAIDAASKAHIRKHRNPKETVSKMAVLLISAQ